MLNEDQKKTSDTCEEQDELHSDERVDRRSAAKKAGKFLTYTAPALIALITAKNANAT